MTPPASPYLPYTELALLWCAWCGLHSLLLWPPLRSRMQEALGLGANAYRAVYSLLALVSLVAVYFYGRGLAPHYPLLWTPPLWTMAAAWAAGAGVMAWAWLSFRHGGVDLMGWSQAAAGHHEPPRLVTGGAYAVSRHPMYLASLPILWVRPLGPGDVLISALLSLYLFLGGLHEERRLRAAFGPAWQAYTQKVGWLFPRRKNTLTL